MVIEIASGRRRPARRRSRPARRASFWPALTAILVLAIVAGLGLAPEDALDDFLDAAVPNRGDIVLAGGVQVTDGDTFRIGAERIRVENIDTPELGDGAECLAERHLADLALQHARVLLASGELRVERTGADQYGRTLARVSVGGRDFGRAMIGAGLAERWTGRRVDWCR
jgi:endonuclease YncB( thermonuclease family)